MILSPVFAKGKASEATITSQSVVSGRTVSVVADASGYSVDDYVYASDASGANAEYLGKVISVTSGTTVTCEWPRRFVRGAGAKLWKADDVWQALSIPAHHSADVRFEPGVEGLETTGGEPILTQTKDARDLVDLLFQDVLISDRVSFIAFVKDVLSGGLRNFSASYVHPDSRVLRCDTVKFFSPSRVGEASSRGALMRSWNAELLIVGENQFV